MGRKGGMRCDNRYPVGLIERSAIRAGWIIKTNPVDKDMVGVINRSMNISGADLAPLAKGDNSKRYGKIIYSDDYT